MDTGHSSTLEIAPETIFPANSSRPGSVWLDSSRVTGDSGRTSIIATHPVAELRLTQDRLTTRKRGQADIVESSVGISGLMERLMNTRGLTAIGYFGFEAICTLLGLKSRPQATPIPDAAFFLYDKVSRFDHCEERKIGESTACRFTETDQHRSSRLSGELPPARLSDRMPRAEYLAKVARIKHHISEGDIYQANFTCRFEVESEASPFAVFRRLRELNPAPYGGFLNFGDFQILSSSPERMLCRRGDWITSSPIKGTIDRGANSQAQERNLCKLLSSEKDRAELLMIVDLVRNDLGKIAQTGSVTVDHLFRPEVYSSLIHLVADISARLRSGTTMTDICKALLPGGSITGAPKRRAVEIIREIENRPRSVYTGCIGYINGIDADFSIAIRSMYCVDGRWYLHAGGGIVADSDPEAEYGEMLLKAKNLFKALDVTL